MIFMGSTKTFIQEVVANNFVQKSCDLAPELYEIGQIMIDTHVYPFFLMDWAKGSDVDLEFYQLRYSAVILNDIASRIEQGFSDDKCKLTEIAANNFVNNLLIRVGCGSFLTTHKSLRNSSLQNISLA